MKKKKITDKENDLRNELAKTQERLDRKEIECQELEKAKDIVKKKN